MEKVTGGPAAEAFVASWRKRIQENFSFPLSREDSDAVKQEYKDWYLENLQIERTSAETISALANRNPEKSSHEKGEHGCCCTITSVVSVAAV